MTYYEKLKMYFPEHELKNPDHLALLIEQKEVYRKEETDEYIVLYAEFETFLFVDYVLVQPGTRGKGIGTKVMNKLKAKGKTVILEVEPVCPSDPDTAKRKAFYEKNGFVEADRIHYEREDDGGASYTMDVLYWSAHRLSQRTVYEQMRLACHEIHNYRARRFYGRLPADPDEVLRFTSTPLVTMPLIREPALAVSSSS